MPQGKITLDDRFVFRDVFTIKNELSVETPFVWASEITSVYVFNVDSENSIYLTELSLNYLNRSEWVESGYSANYSYFEGEEDDSQTHGVKFKVKTPLTFLKYIDTDTVYEVDENIYKSRISIRTEESRAEFGGSLELEENFMDAAVSADVDSPALYIPRTKIVAKKDFTEEEKRVELAIHLAEPKDRSAEFAASWLVEDENYAKASITLDTWIKPLQNIQADVLYVNSIKTNDSAQLNFHFKVYPEQEAKVEANYSEGNIDVEVTRPNDPDERLKYHGKIVEIEEGQYRIDGDLMNFKLNTNYKVAGTVTMQDEKIYEILIDLTPRDKNSKEDTFAIEMQRENYGLEIRVDSNRTYSGKLDLKYINPLNWNTSLELVPGGRENPEKKHKYEFNTFMNVQVNGNTTIYVSSLMPWEEFERFQFDGNMLLSDTSGSIKVKHRLNSDTSHGLLAWKLIYLVDMYGKVVAGINEKSVDGQVFLRNPKKAFKNVEVGFDVNIDEDRWRFASNATVGIVDKGKFDAVLSVRLPPPDNDHHRLLVTYHSNRGLQDTRYVFGYNAHKARTNYASDGSVRFKHFNHQINRYKFTKIIALQFLFISMCLLKNWKPLCGK